MVEAFSSNRIRGDWFSGKRGKWSVYSYKGRRTSRWAGKLCFDAFVGKVEKAGGTDGRTG